PSRFPRFRHTYSSRPSGDTASPAGISFLRFGAFASGSEIVRFGETFPSFATANSLMFPFTLLRKIRVPSGENTSPVKLSCPDLSTGSGAFDGVPAATLGSAPVGVAGEVLASAGTLTSVVVVFDSAGGSL